MKLSEEEQAHRPIMVHDDATQLAGRGAYRPGGLADEFTAAMGAQRPGRSGVIWTQIETQLRRISMKLRPTNTGRLGLMAALEFLAERITKRTNAGDSSLKVRRTAGLPLPLKPRFTRIVQDGLVHAAKALLTPPSPCQWCK